MSISGKKLSLTQINQRGFDHILLAVACFVLVGFIGAYYVVATHAATATAQWTGRLENSSSGSGYCLTSVSTASGSTSSGANGAYAVLAPCTSAYSADQVWSIYNTQAISIPGEGLNYATATGFEEFTIHSAVDSTECLNDWQSDGNNGVQMRLYPCSTTNTADAWVTEGQVYNANPNQFMNLAASDISITGGRVKNSTGAWPDNMCLDNSYGTKKAGNKVQTWSCKNPNQNPANQEWFKVAAPASSSSSSTWYGELQLNANKSYCMNDNNNSTTAKTPIGIYACNKSVAQKWTLTKNSAGQFLLKNGEGLCAYDANEAVSTSSTTVKLETYTCSSTDHAQLWVWNGTELENAYGKGCIKDAGSTSTNLTQLSVASCANTTNEQWIKAYQ